MHLQGDGFASEPGGILEATMWLLRTVTSLGLVPQLCYVGSQVVKVEVLIICKVIIHKAYGLV